MSYFRGNCSLYALAAEESINGDLAVEQRVMSTDVDQGVAILQGGVGGHIGCILIKCVAGQEVVKVQMADCHVGVVGCDVGKSGRLDVGFQHPLSFT